MLGLRAAAAALILSCSVGAAAAEAASPDWVPAGQIGTARYDAAGAPLADGGALLIGGRPSGGSAITSVERFDAVTGTWAPTGSLTTGRNSGSAVALADGRVLAGGGESRPLEYLDSTEVYAPATGTWSAGPRLRVTRSAFALQRLPDGRVLAVGGFSPVTATTGAEVLDIAAGTSTFTQPMSSARANPAVTALADGRVFVAGGWRTGNWDTDWQLASAEIYDPATNGWTAIAPMHERRMHANAVQLRDGRVLVAGGLRTPGPPTFIPVTSDTYEIYDPATNTWTTPKALNRPRGEGAQLAVLRDGRPVVVGGYTQADWSYEKTAEVYDAATDTWTLTPPMTVGRSGHVAVRLSDGSVLVASGFSAGRSSERLALPAEPPATSPEIPVNPPVTTPPAATPPPTPAKPGTLEVAVAKTLKPTRAGGLTFKARCVGDAACKERLTLRIRGGRTLARADVKVAAGKSKTVKLTLSRADRRRLAGRTTKVVVTLGATTYKATLKVR